MMQTYQVQVRRENAQQVVATTRAFHLTLGAKRGDETAGFNPVETLLSAMGACVLTSLAMVANLSRVPIERMAIEVTGTRQDKPPRLVSATYHLVVETLVSDERVVRLVEMAKKNSTVYQTLAATMSVSGHVTRKNPGHMDEEGGQ
jgi:putative redox protein